VSVCATRIQLGLEVGCKISEANTAVSVTAHQFGRIAMRLWRILDLCRVATTATATAIAVRIEGSYRRSTLEPSLT
jgi:hypothetical protein